MKKVRPHAEQTMGKVLGLARQFLESHNVFALDKECIANGFQMFCKCLVRRVEPGAAGNFIAQLPSVLHEQLLAERVGPDVSINTVVAERLIRRAMGLKKGQESDALIALAETLIFSISPGEVDAISSQLPTDWREVFRRAQSGEAAA